MRKSSTLAVLASLLAGCSTLTSPVTSMFASSPPPPPLVLAQPVVDLSRFGGEWYVLGTIPMDWEAGAYNAKETYAVKPNGSMDATFSYRAGADGPQKRYHSIAYPVGPGNVVWGQHYLWPVDMVLPLEFDYRIAYVSPDYQQAVIARGSRDYVWILARKPQIAEADYQSLLNFVGSAGYNVSLVQRVPQDLASAN